MGGTGDSQPMKDEYVSALKVKAMWDERKGHAEAGREEPAGRYVPIWQYIEFSLTEDTMGSGDQRGLLPMELHGNDA
jgi:hypothetical protein